VISLPVLRTKEIIDLLNSEDIKCRIGRFEFDVPPRYKPYYEKWLANRDGFICMLCGNIDFVGSEDIVRMGPFHNVYCLVQNQHLIENDINHQNLLNSRLYYTLTNGVVNEVGWSGSILAARLTRDQQINNFLIRNLLSEVSRSISVRVVDFACLIECRIWHPKEFAFLYGILDNIATDIRDLLKDIHVGENINR